jgi:hypothetical protein
MRVVERRLEACRPSRCAASGSKSRRVPLTKLVSAAARSRLATAALKRLTSARSPKQNAAWVTFGRCVSAHRCSVPLFGSRRAHRPPGPKTAGQSARPQAHAAIENCPHSQAFVFNRILPTGRPYIAPTTLVGGGKRQEGEGCAIIIFPRDFGGFSESGFSLSRVSYWPSGPDTPAAWSYRMVSQRCDGPTYVSVSGSWQRCHRCPCRDLRPRHGAVKAGVTQAGRNSTRVDGSWPDEKSEKASRNALAALCLLVVIRPLIHPCLGWGRGTQQEANAAADLLLP